MLFVYSFVYSRFFSSNSYKFQRIFPVKANQAKPKKRTIEQQVERVDSREHTQCLLLG